MHRFYQTIKNIIQKILTEILFWKEFQDIGTDSIVIDCGANVGDITLKFAKKGAAVYAFEPNPYAFERLTSRLKNYDKVNCINKGVWKENTISELYFHKKAKGDEIFWSISSSILKEKNNVNEQDAVKVELVDIAEFINNLGQTIDLLKIDIEGAECEVLEKLILTETYKKVTKIVVETHDTKIVGQKEKTDKIRGMIQQKNIQNIKLSWL